MNSLGSVEELEYEEELTLRDYFAAKAMPVLIADYLKDMDWETDNPYEHFNCAIEVSYKIADAMMKAREQ